VSSGDALTTMPLCYLYTIYVDLFSLIVAEL
jgi:hypothetical protein